MRNPFSTHVVENEGDFCNRKTEISDMMHYARSSSNVVLFSPRRYGKTSLIKRVLINLGKNRMLTAYIDLFPIANEHDFVERLAAGIFKGIGRGADPRSIAEKVKGFFSGFFISFDVTQEGLGFSVKFDRSARLDVLLDDLMEGVRSFVKKEKRQAVVALDEFQEVTVLPEAKKIEGVLRSHIQTHKDIAYFFIGSRRKTLKDIFTDRSRPFYKSAFLYTLQVISKEDFVLFIVKRFKDTGKRCSRPAAEKLYDLVEGYPYYVQKLAANSWEITEKECSLEAVEAEYRQLIKMESYDFEGIWSGLSLLQKSVLKALAEDPTPSPYSKGFLGGHGLSAAGVQKGIDALIENDLIEKDSEGRYKLVDPVMRAWLTNK